MFINAKMFIVDEGMKEVVYLCFPNTVTMSERNNIYTLKPSYDKLKNYKSIKIRSVNKLQELGIVRKGKKWVSTNNNIYIKSSCYSVYCQITPYIPSKKWININELKQKNNGLHSEYNASLPSSSPDTKWYNRIQSQLDKEQNNNPSMTYKGKLSADYHERYK